ncbi:Na(+)/H(+)-K(+) antiporter GerN [Streptomyces sp. RB17]|uniref:cation:proton antiporter n=1 Tax=Streptomyces sp. RB17 TaxID=2585197 RepID=UPI0012956C93|nr:cation:proton antiporter [Streptomyces sp. RB17]MQY35032.1 Na(+)/H(+)-K(+) antiporter GerN [Streptomyces sp. RB17]
MTPPAHHVAAGGADAVLGPVLSALALILVAAFLCGRLAERWRQPAVMGEIVAGVALGPSLLGLFPGDPVGLLFPTAARPYLQVLAQVGLVLFMFGVGHHFDIGQLRGVGRQVTAVSLGSVALPFALGAGAAAGLYAWHTPVTADGSTPTLLGFSLFLGTAMSITAFPVLARIIADRGLHRERLGSMSLACAAVQDLIAWCGLATLIVVVSAGEVGSLLRMAGWSVLLLLVLVYAVRPALRRLLAPGGRIADAGLGQVVLVAGALLTAWATQEIGLHAVFGAFAFGAVVPKAEIARSMPDVPVRIEQSSRLLLPVFFTVTGLSVDLAGLGLSGVVMVVVVTAVAIVGKFGGALGAARLTGVPRREARALGILMNARGLTELVILGVGLQLGLLDTKLFTAMVTMAVVTTFMTGPLLERFYPMAGTAAASPAEPVPSVPGSTEPAVKTR